VGQFEIWGLTIGQVYIDPQMLVIEIAAGVLLGLVLYKSLEGFCERRGYSMPAGILLIVWRTVLIAAPIVVVVLAGPYLYTKSVERFRPKHRFITSDDPKELPPDPPGYFYIREMGKTTEDWNNPQDPLLRGGRCVADCDTRPLWLIPKSAK
jgi:hypothetical protein